MENITEYYSHEPSRGRPRGRQSYAVMSVLNSIAQIAIKNNLTPSLLLDALVEAWLNKESYCEKLHIICRKVDHNIAVFLITHNDNVVSQFPISIQVLQQPQLFKSYISSISIPIPRNDVLIQKQIGELRVNMKRLNVKGKIVEVPPKTLVNTIYGWDAYVSNILLADKTGTIRLSLWNEQIDSIAVGDTVNIEKAKVAMFHGELQLRIGRNGTINVIPALEK